MRSREIPDLWEPECTYLNTASYGLPPRPAWEALQAALEEWRTGSTSWEHWNDQADAARAIFARLVEVDVESVAIGATVSGLVGLVVAAIPNGSNVLVPDVDFTSLLFPFLVQRHRDIRVRTVPARALADEIDSSTDVVAFSAVQMATGEVADLDAIVAAAREHDALTLVDATHALGWLPLQAARFDAVVAAGYKWLLTLRGTAYLTTSAELLDRIVPSAAGWYAGEAPYETFFGLPLRLARSARRLDTSPAWHSWVTATQSLSVLEDVGIERIHAHDLALANRFRAGLGVEPGNSAIVMSDLPGAAEKLERAGIRAAVRGGRLRTSWHLYNTDADVDRTLEALLD